MKPTTVAEVKTYLEQNAHIIKPGDEEGTWFMCGSVKGIDYQLNRIITYPASIYYLYVDEEQSKMAGKT